MKKLYKVLQDRLETKAVFDELLNKENMGSALINADLSTMDYYTPEDSDGSVRKSILKKIASKYYNRETFTSDTLFFSFRLLGRLNEIMPTYKAKFNALFESGAFDALIAAGMTTTENRAVNDSTNGNDTNTGNNSQTYTSGISTTTTNTGTVQNSDSSQSFTSDYPQTIVGSTEDYNNGATKESGTNTRTDNTTETTTNSGQNTTSDIQNWTQTHLSSRARQDATTRNRTWTPTEIVEAKAQLTKIVMNIEQDIVNDVSNLFHGVVWDEDYDEEDLDEISRQLALLSRRVAVVKARVDELDFTDEQIEYINYVPTLKNDLEIAEQAMTDIIAEIAEITHNLLPDVDVDDAGKMLSVNSDGAWDVVEFANWATEGY